jgi:hypothetical protein
MAVLLPLQLLLLVGLLIKREVGLGKKMPSEYQLAGQDMTSEYRKMAGLFDAVRH